MSHAHAAPHLARTAASGAFRRNLVIGLIAFLTVVDLFATQAILPSLARAYGVSPAAMGLAVNASTIGMAVAGLAVAFFSRRIDRRARHRRQPGPARRSRPRCWRPRPDLATFTALRVAQGVFMSAAFTLTLAYLGERCSAADAAGALAAYVTGNVASNLFGRLMSAAVADHLGLATNFYVFALLNLARRRAGLVLARAHAADDGARAAAPPRRSRPGPSICATRRCARGFAIGFLILFAFIGTFTFVNFVLTREPLAVSPMALGFVYLVFLPAIFTTPLAGRVVARFGTRPTFWGALGVAAAGLPLLLTPSLPAVLAGLALVGVGTFFAQATATGFVGRAATTDRGSASGIYLACYFLGGLVGTAVLGQLFDRLGWAACVAGIGLALALAAWLAAGLRMAAPVKGS